MTFNTLEERFLATSKDIYNRFSSKRLTDEIKPNTADSKTQIRNDSRMFPIRSTVRDLSLMGNYLKSNDGLLFLGKQLLLQTGNTFAETRLYNPLGTLIHTIPFIHIQRQISVNTRENRGGLQPETIQRLQEPSTNLAQRLLSGVRSAGSALNPFNANTDIIKYARPEISVDRKGKESTNPMLYLSQPKNQRGTKRGIGQTEKQLTKSQPTFNTTGNRKPYYASTSKLSLSLTDNFVKNGLSGQVYSADNPYDSDSRRLDQSLSKFALVDNSAATTVDSSGTVFFGTTREGVRLFTNAAATVETVQSPTFGKKVIADIEKLNPDFQKSYARYLQQTMDGSGRATKPDGTTNIFSELIDKSLPYFETAKKFNLTSLNADNAGIARDDDGVAKSNIQDRYNLGEPIGEQKELDDLTNKRVIYSPIVTHDNAYEEKSDIVKFIFRGADGTDPVHFRAFIDTFSENVKPDYNEQKYLGRPERFVTYAGAKRTAKVTFNIVAFSADEINNMWLRVNYLTGLAFPKGATNSGFMVPPLFKITMGGIYENQPCYLDTLDYEFINEQITFDIDKEVSQYIKVNMSIVVLEKTTRFSNSPFYAINEDNIKTQLDWRRLQDNRPAPLSADLLGDINSSISPVGLNLALAQIPEIPYASYFPQQSAIRVAPYAPGARRLERPLPVNTKRVDSGPVGLNKLLPVIDKARTSVGPPVL